MKILTILYFFIVIYGLGYTLTRFLKNDLLETHICRLGLGLGALPVIGVVLNLLHVPLDWKIFLVLAVGPFLFDVFKNRKEKEKEWPFKKPTRQGVLLLLIFASMVALYCRGPFNYPWLEDDDSWAHASGIKYIAVEKNIRVEPGVFHYINPYPPGYDLVFGLLHQIHPSLYWTLKFFNGFIIALGFLFFYIFAKEFSGSQNKALLSTFFLSVIPCYLSHFIWAHSLAVTLFFPALYLLIKTKSDKRFIAPCGIVIAGIFLTQPTQSLKFLILVALFLAASMTIEKKSSKNTLAALCIAFLLALIWWGPVAMNMASDSSVIARRSGVNISGHSLSTLHTAKGLFHPQGGTATQKYYLKDYLSGPKNNKINNPIGVGATLLLLSSLGFLFILYRAVQKRKIAANNEKIYYTTLLLWLVFTFLGLNSMTFNLPVGLFAFRFWMLFAIPVCFLAGEFLLYLMRIPKMPTLKYAILIFVLLSVFKTSATFKVKVNTSVWPYGVFWVSPQEIRGYVWLRKNLPAGTKVFAFSDNSLVIGHNMHADFWTEKYTNSFKNAMDMDVSQLHAALKENNFKYLIMGVRDTKKYGLKRILKKKEDFDQSPLYRWIFGIKKGAVVYKIL